MLTAVHVVAGNQVEDAADCPRQWESSIVRDLVTGAAVVVRDADGNCPQSTTSPTGVSDAGYVLVTSYARLSDLDPEGDLDAYGVMMR